MVTENEEGIGTPLDKELSHFLKEGLFIVVTNVVIVKIFDKTWKKIVDSFVHKWYIFHTFFAFLFVNRGVILWAI